MCRLCRDPPELGAVIAFHAHVLPGNCLPTATGVVQVVAMKATISLALSFSLCGSSDFTSQSLFVAACYMPIELWPSLDGLHNSGSC